MRRALLVLLASAGMASAGNRTTVAVVAVDIGPGVPAYLAASLSAQIASGLAAAAYDVVPAPALRGELARCREDSCMAKIGHAVGTDQLVVAAITASGENRVIAMRLYDASGAQLAELQEVCDLCGDSELVEHVGLSASALRARAAEPRRVHARSKVPGIAAVAAGAVVLGGGIALLALDGRGSCSPGDSPVYPDAGAVIRYPDPANHASYVCRDVYATKGLGIAGIAAGAIGVAVGVALIVRAGHRETIQVAPTPGGATIGMALAW